ncbi:glycosyltransferase family 2 protein [Asanoa sp. NPDC049573]|uniref:glycosyltransferase family 2 protein n=1 Tax=Asanoa sp. NPDC049573 TaxID=3155396 RepID=UPI00344944EB
MSVIVPVYRVEHYLGACLDSILDQGFADFEVVAVDDASDDGSAAILAGYAARDNRVRVLTLPTNRGLGAARNAGLAAATGDYVWFVDSDDWLTEGTLEAVAKRLAETDADLLITGFARVFPDGRIRHSPVTGAGPAPAAFRLAELPGLIKLLHIACNKVIRRQLLVELGLAFRPGWYEDVAFSLPLMIAADRITLLDRYSYGYRQRDTGSITRTVSDRHFDVFDQWGFVFHFIDDRQAEELRAPLFARAVWHQLQVLNHSARVPRPRRREFFGRLVDFYRAERPAGGYEFPHGDEGVKQRLVARNAFLLFEALRAGRRMQTQAARRVAPPRQRDTTKPPVPDAVP